MHAVFIVFCMFALLKWFCGRDPSRTIFMKLPQIVKHWTIFLGASMLLLQFPKVYSRPLRGPRIVKPNATTMTSLQYKELKLSLLQTTAVDNFVKVLFGFELCDLILGTTNAGDRDTAEMIYNSRDNYSLGKILFILVIFYSTITTRLPGIVTMLTYTSVYKVAIELRSIMIIKINHSSFQDSYWELIHTVRDWLTDISKIILLTVNLMIIFYIPWSLKTNQGIDSLGTGLAVLNWAMLVLETYSEYRWLSERDRLRFGMGM